MDGDATSNYVYNPFNSFLLKYHAWTPQPLATWYVYPNILQCTLCVYCVRTTQGFMSNIDSCVKMQKSSRWHINCKFTQPRWDRCWRKILWEKVGSCMITLLNIFLWYILNPPPWQEDLPPSIYCAICYTTYTSIIYRLWYNVLSLDAVRSWVLIISRVHLHVVKFLIWTISVKVDSDGLLWKRLNTETSG